MGKMIDVLQGTDEWKACRAGFATGSKMKAVLTVLKDGGDSKAREDYKAQLISEILSGEPTDDDLGDIKAIRRGKEFEPLARADYELFHGVEVDQVGFVQHATVKRMGCSPDGLVGKVGGTEFKVPYPKNHIKYLLAGGLPAEYEPQCMTELSCCEEMEWLDFTSYCPEIKQERLQQFTVRVYRKEHIKRIAFIEDMAGKFNREIDVIVAELLAIA